MVFMNLKERTTQLFAFEHEVNNTQNKKILQEYVTLVQELHAKLDGFLQEKKIYTSNIAQRESILKEIDVAIKYPKGVGNLQLRKEYLQELMDSDSVIQQNSSKLFVIEAEIEFMRTQISILEDKASIAKHLDEINTARLNFLAANSQGTFEKTKEKLTEIEKYFKIDVSFSSLQAYLEKIEPLKNRLASLQEKKVKILRGEEVGSREEVSAGIEEIQNELEFLKKQNKLAKWNTHYNAARISFLAGTDGYNTLREG
jgi:hypothetical protein